MTSALNLERRDDIAIITFDLPGESINKITRGVRAEFAALFDELERDTSIKAVVWRSGKADNFVAGADIE